MDYLLGLLMEKIMTNAKSTNLESSYVYKKTLICEWLISLIKQNTELLMKQEQLLTQIRDSESLSEKIIIIPVLGQSSIGILQTGIENPENFSIIPIRGMLATFHFATQELDILKNKEVWSLVGQMFKIPE